MMPEHVLVTGAGGFLGSHICNYLGRLGYRIAAIDRLPAPSETATLYPNLSNFYSMSLPDKTLISIMGEFEPALFIHCAGTASVPYSMQEPYEDFQQSAGITAFILESIRNHMPSCHFIFLSSAAVYGNPGTLPISEDAPCQPVSPYGYHKHICEMLCREYQSIYSIKSSVLRIFSAYGERLRKQVLFDLCRKFADPLTDRIEVYGTGEETRDFLHASDIAQAVELIHKSGSSGVFNVATGVQTRISEVVEMVGNCFQSSKKIVYSGSVRPGDPLYWQADISRLSSLGFRQRIPLEEGIRNYCRWFESI